LTNLGVFSTIIIITVLKEMYHGFANSVKNIANNAVMGVSEKLDLNSPPTTDHFRLNGRLSPSEFVRVGDKLVDSCGSWT
jgi:hypothetical protein